MSSVSLCLPGLLSSACLLWVDQLYSFPPSSGGNVTAVKEEHDMLGRIGLFYMFGVILRVGNIHSHPDR